MGGLSFLSPLYLLGALAIAVPIALHLFRRRTDVVVDFPAVRLLAHTPVEQQRRKRLRELILLALRVSALGLLAFAFARPYFSGRVLAADTPVTVVAVDRSFSVSAPAVFDRVKELAAAAASEAPAAHAVALVAFDDTADVLVAPTTDRGAIAAAIRQLTPGVHGTQYAAALSRASEVLGARAGALEVVTDLQQAGWRATAREGLADDVEVRIRRVDVPLRNLAVARAERRGNRVEGVARNFGLEARTAAVTLRAGDAEVSRLTVTVPANGVVPFTFSDDAPDGGGSVTIADEGGVPADDTRYLVLDPSARTRVLIVVANPTSREGGLYVERALGAADRGRAFDATVLDGRSLSAWTSDQMAREQVVVLLGTRTLERRGRELIKAYLSGGGPALLSLGPDIDVSTLGDVLDLPLEVDPEVRRFEPADATLVLEDTRHPVFRPFATPAAALGDVPVERYRSLDKLGGRVLARFSGGSAALVEASKPAGRLLVFASDLDTRWNRFPLSPAFVPFMVETVRYLAEAGQQSQSWVLPAVPKGVNPVPGIHTMPSANGEPGRLVAVNVDLEESNPAPVPEAEFLDAIPRVPRTEAPDVAADVRRVEDNQRLWQWGLLLMFVALAGEGLVGRRAT